MNQPVEQRDWRLMRHMFGAIAPCYDFVTRAFSFGMDGQWKRVAVQKACLVEGATVLDLACGTGRWLEKVMARGCESGVGVDGSAAMLRVARGKREIAGRLAQATCEVLPFREAVFDLVICSFALGHLRDLRCMVRELARVMKPGADCLVSDLDPNTYAEGWRVGFRDQDAMVQIEMHPRTAVEIIQVFCANGFECLRRVPLWLGEEEKPIFARAGKTLSFADCCRFPAILVCHFKRLDLPFEPRRI